MNATTNQPAIPLICKQMFKNLESVPLFKEVDDYILHLLEPLFEPFSCPEGTVIFEQGEPAHFLYLVLEGSVEGARAKDGEGEVQRAGLVRAG